MTHSTWILNILNFFISCVYNYVFFLQKCTICKPRKGNGKKSKDGYNVNGATAGCALKACQKTYHYCCAYSDPTAITKRILMKSKHLGKQIVLYRFVYWEKNL